MEIYDYLSNEVKDVIDYLKDNKVNFTNIDQDTIANRLNTQLFNEDSVTGNGSGSYTFNTVKAERNLVGNWELLHAAIAELDPSFNAVDRGAEACDVLVRLYLLPTAISEALKQLL